MRDFEGGPIPGARIRSPCRALPPQPGRVGRIWPSWVPTGKAMGGSAVPPTEQGLWQDRVHLSRSGI